MVYDTTYRVMICLDCGYAYQSPLGHLKKKHPDSLRQLTKALREAIKVELDTLKEELNVEPLIHGVVPRIKHLKFIDGLKCAVNGCGFCCQADSAMKRHHSGKHPSLPSSQPNKIFIQTFYEFPMKYFEVLNVPNIEGPNFLQAMAALVPFIDRRPQYSTDPR